MRVYRDPDDRPGARAVIGYYVHHQGHGHLHRATAVAQACDGQVTGLSTHPRPAGWVGDWIALPDDAHPEPADARDAHGHLHYVPDHHPGLRARMAAISAWIDDTDPDLLVADVSVEVALLARLHGVPVATVALPGSRTDGPHQLGYGVSDAVIGPWPAAATPLLHQGSARVTAVGALSRYAPLPHPQPVRSGTALVLNGSGGAALTATLPIGTGWTFDQLGGAAAWVEDPWSALCSSEVVISHAGQNAVAEIAAARRPAVIIPQARPFDEQRSTGWALRSLGLPAVVLDRWPTDREWPAVLHRAAALDGSDWARWNDGQAADRMAELLLHQVATSTGPGRRLIA